MTMSIWVFLMIVGLALLTGHSARAKAAAVVFLVIGVLIGASGFGDAVRSVVDIVSQRLS